MGLLQSGVLKKDAEEFCGLPLGGVFGIFNGMERPWKYEPESQSYKHFGMLCPESELTAEVVEDVSGQDLNGTYIYTFVEADGAADQGEGLWSGPPRDSEGVSVVVAAGQAVQIAFPSPVNSETTHFWLYRTLAGASWSTLGRIAVVAVGDTYIDNGDTPDLLNFPLDPNRWPTPNKTYPFKMQQRLLLWGAEALTTTLVFTEDETEATWYSGDELDAGVIGSVIYPTDQTRGYLITGFKAGSPGTVVFQDAFEGALGSPDSQAIECIICRPQGELAWSEPDDYENFPQANVRYIELSSTDPESGAAVINGRGMLFTAHKTYGLDFQQRPDRGWGSVLTLSESIGCMAHRTIQDCGGFLLWLAEGGIAMSEGGRPQIISDDIWPEFNDVVRERTGRARRAFAVNWARKRRYICFVPVDGDVTGCSRAIVVDYKTPGGGQQFKFTVYDFHKEFTCACIERQAVVSEGTTTYLEYVVLGCKDGYVWTFGTGDADGPESGTVSGVVTSATDTPGSFQDSGAAFDTDGLGLAGVPVTVERPSTGTMQHKVISTNTTTEIFVSGDWDWMPEAGDLYRIGEINSYYETGWMHFGADHLLKKLDRLVTTFEPKSAGSLNMEVFTDFNTTAIALTREGGTIDLTQTNSRESRLLSGRRHFYTKVRYGNREPNQPWRLRQACLLLLGDDA